MSHSLDSFVKPLDILYNTVFRGVEPGQILAGFNVSSPCNNNSGENPAPFSNDCFGGWIFTRQPSQVYAPNVPISYTWNFGDGVTLSGVALANDVFYTTHYYNVTGTYIVTLTISSPYGSANITTTVQAVNRSNDAQPVAVTIVPYFRTQNPLASFQSVAVDGAAAVVQTFIFTPPVSQVFVHMYLPVGFSQFTADFYNALGIPLLGGHIVIPASLVTPCNTFSYGSLGPGSDVISKLIITPSGGSLQIGTVSYYTLDATEHLLCGPT